MGSSLLSHDLYKFKTDGSAYSYVGNFWELSGSMMTDCGDLAIISAPGPVIGIYSDPEGKNCNLLDQGPGQCKYYVVLYAPQGARGAEFRVPTPTCATISLVEEKLSDAVDVAIGNSQTGISVAFGDCLYGVVPLLELTYSCWGTTGSCCEWPVLANPSSGMLQIVDCAFQLQPATGLVSVINPDNTCPCGAPVIETGTITIVKESVPPDGTDFAFTGDLGGFTLDDADPDDNDGIDDSVTITDVAVGDYSVSELVPAGWYLYSVSCVGGDSDPINDGVNIHLDADEEITCTFSNVKFGISLRPEKDINLVGEMHWVTATLDPAWAGIPVLFEIAGANPQNDETVMTNGIGEASSTAYPGKNAGMDTITACIDLDGDEACEPGDGEPTDVVVKYWVDEYVQLSGGILGQGSKGKGGGKGAPTHSFDGFAGDADGAAVGEIVVNYSLLGKTCTFTPNGGSFTLIDNGKTARLLGWTNSCTGESTNIWLRDRGLVPPRGGIEIRDADGSNTAYNIVNNGGGVALDRGNIHVVDLSP